MNHPVRLLSVLLFFNLGTYPVYSQAPPADKKAQEILNGVSSRYKTYKSVKANFTITVINPKDKSKTVEKGTLFLKGTKYKLDVAGQEVISDGKTRWTYVKDANEVQIDIQRTDENGITPTNIFTMYEKGWNSRFMGETKEGTRTLQQVELVPVDPKKKNIFKVKLSINKADKSIVSAVMFDKNGSTQTITVDKFLPDGASEESLYVFTAGKYPGAEIIDLR